MTYSKCLTGLFCLMGSAMQFYAYNEGQPTGLFAVLWPLVALIFVLSDKET